MNSLLKDKVELLHQKILEEDCIKDYLQYKKLVVNHFELLELEKEVQLLQKQLMAKRYYGKDADDLAHLYASKRKELDENPWVQNYLLAKEEANQYLEHISLYISSRL